MAPPPAPFERSWKDATPCTCAARTTVLCLVLLWRGLVKAERWTCSWCTCCMTRPTTSRRISEQGVLRTLDPDSESEAEAASDPCEAVLVGLELQGKPRALAPDGCEDRAASEPTRLMEGDVHLSDLGGKVTARLCNHHSQLYLLSCQGRKCSVVSCFDKVHGEHKGTPLCMKHLSETGRSNSPTPKALGLSRNEARRADSELHSQYPVG